MVRNIVGTLLEVGEGKMTLSKFKEVIQAGDRSQAGPTVPSWALTLVEARYKATCNLSNDYKDIHGRENSLAKRIG